MIAINNVTKTFQNNAVLQNVSLTIKPNKIYGLLGRNGVGKTTLLNLMTNRLFPTEGTITIDGEVVTENDKAIEKIYFMSQQALFPESIKVKDLFKWTAVFYPHFDHDYALSLCKKFKLNPKSKYKNLSTGYSSICKIILTLSSGAPILLFDEPVLGLDAHYREVFYKELITLYSEQEKTIILSTHIIEEVANVIEEVIIINDKTVVNSEGVESLLNRAYTVSGLHTDIDFFIKDKNVVYEETMGAYKAVTIMEILHEDVRKEISDLNLQLSTVELQKLFVYLTSEEAE
ncbi:MAG: ATP-binding cassette domain-containing protein [Bacillaceae bacterium]